MVSKETLSGQLIGLTEALSTPPKYVSAASGSPQTSSRFQVNVRAAWLRFSVGRSSST